MDKESFRKLLLAELEALSIPAEPKTRRQKLDSLIDQIKSTPDPINFAAVVFALAAHQGWQLDQLGA